MTTTQETDDKVIRYTLGVAAVLAHATDAGLPTPSNVAVYDVGMPLLQFRTLEDLTEWSRWCEKPITTETGRHYTRHEFLATELDQPIMCLAITRGAK